MQHDVKELTTDTLLALVSKIILHSLLFILRTQIELVLCQLLVLLLLFLDVSFSDFDESVLKAVKFKVKLSFLDFLFNSINQVCQILYISCGHVNDKFLIIRVW